MTDEEVEDILLSIAESAQRIAMALEDIVELARGECDSTEED